MSLHIPKPSQVLQVILNELDALKREYFDGGVPSKESEIEGFKSRVVQLNQALSQTEWSRSGVRKVKGAFEGFKREASESMQSWQRAGLESHDWKRGMEEVQQVIQLGDRMIQSISEPIFHLQTILEFPLDSGSDAWLDAVFLQANLNNGEKIAESSTEEIYKRAELLRKQFVESRSDLKLCPESQKGIRLAALMRAVEDLEGPDFIGVDGFYRTIALSEYKRRGFRSKSFESIQTLTSGFKDRFQRYCHAGVTSEKDLAALKMQRSMILSLQSKWINDQEENLPISKEKVQRLHDSF